MVKFLFSGDLMDKINLTTNFGPWILHLAEQPKSKKMPKKVEISFRVHQN
jgi:hypothetical protein